MELGPEIPVLGVDTQLLSISPIPLVAVLGAALLYLRACAVLEGRGRTIPGIQRASYLSGLGLILLATQTFIDPIGERSLLSLHMLQHLLIADLPAPLLLYGVRAPLLYFFWPLPVLVRVARMRRLRSFWAWLRQPQVALTVWLVTLYAWHVPVMYELALTHRLAHDLEHVSFALTGVLAWWPLLDPTHERVEGRVWKAGYVFAARMVGGVLGILLIAWPDQLYSPYGDAARAYGMSIITDQQVAGGMMMLVDITIVIVGVTYFLATMDRGSERTNDLDHPAVRAAIDDAAAAERERHGSGSATEPG
ncbi:MAG: Cytochrome c oxidase caa3-type, assembly factor CtaG-related protein [Thermoleophilia bacterium]|nr:Cytochrome c oxidase caa3-type, assembly factor CtaG-related protein [Thermoleophilia bacterium]